MLGRKLPKILLIAFFLTTLTFVYTYYSATNPQRCHPPRNITYTNTYWQTQQTSLGTLHLWTSYLDDRQFNNSFFQKYYNVRILAMYDTLKPRPMYCQLWYDTGETVTVKSDFDWIWRQNWGVMPEFSQPYLISCGTPDSRVPVSVSLVENACDRVTNRLPVHYPKVGAPNNFVVCVKGLNFPSDDLSARLVEWIELVTILGASRIHFYKYGVHPNVDKVLGYYREAGLVEATPLSVVQPSSNQSQFLKEHVYERRLQEVLPFNDCLYKYLYEARYIVSLDIDEVIVPSSGTWDDLMMELQARNALKASYVARNVYFFDQFVSDSSEIPAYMHILKHVTRTKEYSPPGDYVKGFHDTGQVVTLYNHISLKCFSWWACVNVDIEVKLAQLQHYRKDCVKDLKNCDQLKNETVVDSRVWRFKSELVGRTGEVLDRLGLVPG